MKIKHVLVSALLLGLSISCSNDDNGGEEALGAYENGILISNEGPFGNGTGTVSFISNDLSVEESSIYNKVNSEDLGNIVHSIGFADDEAYIIANNSHKIAIADRYTFEKKGEITGGLNNPRFFVAVNGKGYVTNWGDSSDETDDYVAVINLDTYVVEQVIEVVLGPEQLLASGDKIYVAHKGAFGVNDKVSVINTSSNSVEKTITVGAVPHSMQLDVAGNLWVLSKGIGSWPVPENESGGVLSKIDIATDEVTSSINFPANTDHPQHLSIDGNNLYYTLGTGVYKVATSATELPTDAVISDVSFYTMTVSNGKLYGTDAKDFASNGTLHIYNISDYTLTNSFTVGLIPGGVYFN